MSCTSIFPEGVVTPCSRTVTWAMLATPAMLSTLMSMSSQLAELSAPSACAGGWGGGGRRKEPAGEDALVGRGGELLHAGQIACQPGSSKEPGTRFQLGR